MAIKILATSDLHGYIYPTRYSDDSEAAMGLAKLATIIRDLRDENTILIDNGDTIQGSPLTYYHHLFTEDQINPMAMCLNALNYDFVNIGNHDFNYGRRVLSNYLETLEAQCITVNIKSKDGLFDFKPVIKTISNVKIAFFAVTTEHIPNWELPHNIEGITFEKALNSVAETVAQIKELADYIVVAYHGGFECDLSTGEDTSKGTYDNFGYAICEKIAGIDVLITGHQHRSLNQKLFKTHICQTAHNGQEIAYIEIDPLTNEITGQLIAAQQNADETIMNLVQATENNCRRWLDEPMGHFAKGDAKIEDELQARMQKDPCVSFINQIQRDHTKADLSASALFNDASGFNHEIKMKDIVSTYVYPNTLVKVALSGKAILSYLENAAEYFALDDDIICINPTFMDPKPLHFEYDMMDGLDYTINVSKPFGSRIEQVVINAQPLDEEKIYTLVVNNYRMAGGGNYHCLKSGEIIMDDGIEMVEIMAEYIMKHSPITINHKNNIKLKK